MEGVRRNIALKLKPAVGKESNAQRSPSEGGKKKEGEKGMGHLLTLRSVVLYCREQDSERCGGGSSSSLSPSSL